MKADGPSNHPEEQRAQAEFYFAYTGLFFFVFALTQAGLIGYYRSGLYVPGRLLVLGLGLIASTAFAPFLLPAGWRARMASSLYLYPLLSFAVLLSGFSAYALGGLAPLLVYVYAGLGLAAFFRALARLRFMSAAHYAFLLLAAAFGVYVFYFFTPRNYAGVFAPEYALLGRVRKDTYFAAAIAHMLQNFGVSSTGMDGLARLHYHVGAHAWFASLGRAAGTMPLLTYPFLHPIVLLPAQLLALGFSFICAAGTRRSVISYLGGAVAMVFITDALGRPSHYVSESYAAGITVLLFFWPLMLDLIQKPRRGKGADDGRLALALAAIFIIGAAKISAGILWTVALGWVSFRRDPFRPRSIVSIALSGLILLIAGKIFSDPGQAAILAPLKFFAHHPRLLFLSNWIIPGLFLAAVARAEKIGDLSGLRRAVKEKRTLGAEVIVVMAVVAALPSLLLWLSIAWAWFFFNLPQWPAMSMLAATWDFPSPRDSRWRRAAYVGLAALIAAGGYLTAGYLHSAIATGYLRNARQMVDQGGKTAAATPSPARPYGTELDSLLASAPGYRAYRLIMDAAEGRGKGFAVHVPASNEKFWRIVPNCEAQPMFVPAVTGKPMLYGLLPPEIKCDLLFYGYPDYGNDAFARDLDDAAICRHATEKGFDTVFVLKDLDQPARNQILDCASGTPKTNE